MVEAIRPCLGLAGWQVARQAGHSWSGGPRCGHVLSGTTLPLMRLRYAGSAATWGFAIYRASHDDYDNPYPTCDTISA